MGVRKQDRRERSHTTGDVSTRLFEGKVVGGETGDAGEPGDAASKAAEAASKAAEAASNAAEAASNAAEAVNQLNAVKGDATTKDGQGEDASSEQNWTLNRGKGKVDSVSEDNAGDKHQKEEFVSDERLIRNLDSNPPSPFKISRPRSYNPHLDSAAAASREARGRVAESLVSPSAFHPSLAMHGLGQKSRSSEMVALGASPPVSPNLFVTTPSPDAPPSSGLVTDATSTPPPGWASSPGGGGGQHVPLYLNSPSFANSANNNNSLLDSSTGSMVPAIDRRESSVETLSKKASLKMKKKQYRNQKKAAANEVASTLNDPTVIVLAEWLKVRGSLKSWTKLFCCLKPGLLILYKSQKMKSSYWVGTILLNTCELIERPSKKEGFCFKLFHPMDQSIWAAKGPKGESIPAMVQPLPVNYLIFRATSEAAGKCWMDALELALRCSTLLKRSIGGGVASQHQPPQQLQSQQLQQQHRHRRSDGDVRVDAAARGSTSGSASSAMEDSFQSYRGSAPRCGSVSYQPDGSGVDAATSLAASIARSVAATAASSAEAPLPTQLRHLRTGSWTESDLEGHFPRDLDGPDAEDKASPEEEAPSESEASDDGGEAPDDEEEEEEEEGGGGEMTPYVAGPAEEFGELGDQAQTEEFGEENKSVIWELLKQVRPGMDLSRVVLPAFILEPRSFLDKLTDFYYHCDLLQEASAFDDPFLRMKHVLKWYISGFYKKPKGLKKPYNPILGEVFRCCWENPATGSRTFYVAEQVSHHPPISVFHVSNRRDGYCLTCGILARSKFYGNSLQAIMDGQARLTLLKRGEDYVMSMPYANCKGILLGTMTAELGGKVSIECDKTRYRAELDFKLKPFFGGSEASNAVVGKIKLGAKTIATIDGKWDGEILFRDENGETEEVFWKADQKAIARRLKRLVVPVDRQDSWESERLWRRVSAAIVGNDVHAAAEEKGVLEDAQRAAAKRRKERDEEVETKLFEKDELLGEWVYRYADSRPWDPNNDLIQFERDFVIETKTRHRTTVIRTTSLTCVAAKKKNAAAKREARKLSSGKSSSSGGGVGGEPGTASTTGAGSAPRRDKSAPQPKVAALQTLESGSSTGSVYLPEDTESSDSGNGGGGAGPEVGAASKDGTGKKSDNRKSPPSKTSTSSSPRKQSRSAPRLPSPSPAAAAAAAFSPEDLQRVVHPLQQQILQLKRIVEANESERRSEGLSRRDLMALAIVLAAQMILTWILVR